MTRTWTIALGTLAFVAACSTSSNEEPNAAPVGDPPAAAPVGDPPAAAPPRIAIHFVIDAADANAFPIDAVGPPLVYVEQAMARLGDVAQRDRIALGLTLHPRRAPWALHPCLTDADCGMGTGHCSTTVTRVTHGRTNCDGDVDTECASHPDGLGVGRCPGTALLCLDDFDDVRIDDRYTYVASCNGCSFVPFCVPTTVTGDDAYAEPDVALAAPEEAIPRVDDALAAMMPGGKPAGQTAYLASLAHVVRWHAANPTVTSAVVILRAEAYDESTDDWAPAIAAAANAFEHDHIRTFVVGGPPKSWTEKLALAGGTRWMRPVRPSLAARLDAAFASLVDALHDPVRAPTRQGIGPALTRTQ